MTKVNIATITPTNSNDTTKPYNNNNDSLITNNNDSDHNNQNCDSNKDDKSPNSELKPILTQTNSTNSTLVRKKSVTFDNHINENDEVIQKFVVGDIIIDQQNPFKSSSTDPLDLSILETSESTTPNGKKRIIKITTSDKFASLSDDDKITTEDVLKQSKYVKTYIKNPDTVFTYDHTLRDRILSEDEPDSIQTTVRKEKPSIPVPKPRLIGNGHIINNFNNNSIKKQNNLNNTKIVKQKLNCSNSGIKYPDLADLKIKTGTDQDETLYNPIEVAINVKKFDDRFKTVHLGSQDDLDDIGELSVRDDQVDGESSPETENEPKLPYNTNTVTSKEFQEFLKSKGLQLKPDLGHLANDLDTHDMEQQKNKKRSVLGRLFGGGIFAKTAKTTPKESIPAHTQTLYTRSSNNINNLNSDKRVVLERQSMHVPTSSRAPIYRDQDDQTSSISSQLTAADDYIDMNGNDSNDSKINVSPLRRSLRVENNPNALKLKQNYSQPEPTVKNKVLPQSKIKPPSGRTSAPVTYLSDRQESRILSNGSIVLDQRPSEKPQPLSFVQKSPQLSNGVVAPRAQRPNNAVTNLIDAPKSKIKPPVPIRRNVIERQSVGYRKPDEVDNEQSLYGNLNRASSLNRNHRVIQSVPAQVKISRSPVIYSPAANERVEKVTINSCDTITPSNSNEKLLEPKSTSTPKENIVPQQKPQPVAPVQNNSVEWSKLQQLKQQNDRTLYGVNIIAPENLYGKTRRNSIQPENIYESADKIAAQQAQHDALQQQQFARNSAQRNTIGSIYRNRTAQRPALRLPSNSADNTLRRNIPSRSQSVLDNMTVTQYYQQTPVIMRRPVNSQTSQSSLNKEDVMNKVRDFCRRSMNKTPTGINAGRDLLVVDSKSKKDISPVSYASVEGREVARYEQKPPQIPQRTQSLQNKQNAESYQQQHHQANIPIYSPIVKRSSLYSTTSEMEENRPRQNLVVVHQVQKPQRKLSSVLSYKSETDSVFVPDENSVMRPIKLSPRHVIIPQDNMEIYGKINPQYGYVTGRQIEVENPNAVYSVPVKRNSALSANTNSMYSTVRPANNVRYTVDGRGTPLILYSIPHSPQKLVVKPNNIINSNHNNSNNVEKLYRSIVPSNVSQPYYHRNVVQQQPQQLQLQQQPNQQQMSPASVIYGYVPYESESGSEAGEVQRIMQSRRNIKEEDWQNDKSGRNQQTEQVPTDDRRRTARREDPRRHTLGGDTLHYGGQGPPQRTMDLEMGTRTQKSKKTPPVRGYTPVNQGPLFDDDPGIMSEVETASTGFRRGGKQRSSLPVVRTPSKTLERPLGLVFLQYRSETKRALLPNEITSIDTVRALFVRSFPRQLTMAYLEGPNVKIYIHDASKDMFYELEDVRSHLREIRDRSVLRLFESNEVVAPQVLPGGPGVPQPLPQSGISGSGGGGGGGGGTGGHWDQDQSYFSEPEFDSEYQHQHIHKSKGGKTAPYYVGAAQTLPRGMYTDRNKNPIGAPAKPLRSYGSSMGPPFPYPDQLYSIPDGYMSSPERGTRGGYEEPYYSQYGTRGGTVTPIIDEEQSESSLAEDQYSLYGIKVTGRIPRGANQMYDPTRPEDLHRIRIEHMERQLANLTGVVQKALTQNPVVGQIVNPNYLGVPGQCRNVADEIDGHSSSSSTSIQANGTDDLYIREKPPKLGKSSCHKSVSFEKSVSFSDDIQGVQKSHTPQHPADSKPPKPAIKSSTLPRTSSQERDRLKPPPPPKPLGLGPSHQNYRPDLALAPEVYNHLRGLQKKTKDLRAEVRTLRRLSQAQAVAVREDIKDTFMRIRATLLSSSGCYWGQGDQETITRLSREEELYKQEAVRLEKDLGDLENSVENLRTEVINRRTRVNMSSVEDMALVLSRASKTVAELKMKYPSLESGLRSILNNEMEKIIQEEKFMKDEPMRLESALRRCKKLTGTLVTLKRLASVQEQRLPTADPPQSEDPPRSSEVQSANKPIPSPRMGTITIGGGTIAPENALDALLDELQTFAKPSSLGGNPEPRPDDSTSDDSSQTLQNNSTVTIQLSQSSLYHPNDSNNSQQNQQQISSSSSASSQQHHQTHGLRRLHSYPSGSDTDTSPPQPPRPTTGKPPVPERNADLLSKVNSTKRIPPPPPPRTSSRSPLASPTSPNMPMRLAAVTEQLNDINLAAANLGGGDGNHSSSSESVNSQDHMQRQIALELRHQELLKKQKQLQEQYARLQQISKNNVNLQSTNDMLQLKKTGSESNLPQKMGLNMSISGSSGSMKNLLNSSSHDLQNDLLNNSNDINNLLGTNNHQQNLSSSTTTTTNKVYETDIL